MLKRRSKLVIVSYFNSHFTVISHHNQINKKFFELKSICFACDFLKEDKSEKVKQQI